MTQHQFIDREALKVKDEVFYGDRIIRFIYSKKREMPCVLYKIFSSKRLSDFLGFFYYDSFIGSKITKTKEFMDRMGIDYSECLENPRLLNTPRKIFERKILYWTKRPMPEDERYIVSPADSKVMLGSFAETSLLYIKNKFFQYQELLGIDKMEWIERFKNGDFAIFRLTPDKYHYNHTPVSGLVIDFYSIDGYYHSCHPEAIVTLCTPHSKNKRVITIINTDVDGGTCIGIVAMVEVAALLIGDIVQCYSEYRYNNPQNIYKGIFLKRGQPKSLFRPGSSTTILLFQRDRVAFSPDLIKNSRRHDIANIYSRGFGTPLVETDVKVRSPIGKKI
ncbi:MAG TPA: phosphatidylserine decarboxylase [Syntrophorhabdaceae bacterium]|nr:phosphatidylserine decarboxylase [Syntrophorhabdaceae bacterium]HOL04589.1 phosphatidylserine decarboxylase [Syntrophorhabdaceae bacterium]HPP41355.1 phosphatidylserine decarboxylase [Syntrophorhabdaceae bacterium]